MNTRKKQQRTISTPSTVVDKVHAYIDVEMAYKCYNDAHTYDIFIGESLPQVNIYAKCLLTSGCQTSTLSAHLYKVNI